MKTYVNKNHKDPNEQNDYKEPDAGYPSRVQELCESRGGCRGLSVLTSLTVSVDVKQYGTVLQYWSQFVPNMSTDIRGHEALLHHHHPYPTHACSTDCA